MWTQGLLLGDGPLSPDCGESGSWSTDVGICISRWDFERLTDYGLSGGSLEESSIVGSPAQLNRLFEIIVAFERHA